MAAYAATVTLAQRSAAKFGNGGFKQVSGSVAISNYNQTAAEITGITGEFRSTKFTVVCDGISSGGYLVRWSAADKAFKAYSAAGTFAAPVVSIKGSQAAGTALQITPDTNGAVLGKTTATDLTVPGATFGIAAPVFTPGAPTETSNDVNVGTVNFIAFGV